MEKEISCSVGVVKKVLRSKKNIVRYYISFKDDRGKDHLIWSNWTPKCNREEGMGIPVKFMYIPFTMHKMVTVLEIDNLPQYNERTQKMSFACLLIAAASIGVMVGNLMGKSERSTI